MDPYGVLRTLIGPALPITEPHPGPQDGLNRRRGRLGSLVWLWDVGDLDPEAVAQPFEDLYLMMLDQ